MSFAHPAMIRPAPESAVIRTRRGAAPAAAACGSRVHAAPSARGLTRRPAASS